MSVEMPKDANGEVIPLDTVALFGGNGNAYSIRYWVYTTDFDLGDSTAGQWRPLTDKGTRLDPELMYLTEPDSWENLEEDLDKCVAEGTSCTYFSKDGTCQSCPLRNITTGCSPKVIEDIVSRIRKLRGEA